MGSEMFLTPSGPASMPAVLGAGATPALARPAASEAHDRRGHRAEVRLVGFGLVRVAALAGRALGQATGALSLVEHREVLDLGARAVRGLERGQAVDEHVDSASRRRVAFEPPG